MKQILAYGKITGDGQLAFSGYRQFQHDLKQLAGRPVSIVISAFKPGPTGGMIGYFEAVMVPAVKQAIRERGTAMSTGQIREYIRGEIAFMAEQDYEDLDYEDWTFFLGEVRVWAGTNLQLAFEHEIILNKL